MSFRKSHDETEFGVEVKLRNNGSRRLQQAVPNPYSNSEYRGSTVTRDILCVCKWVCFVACMYCGELVVVNAW